MKNNIQTRLQRLETQIRQGDGVIIVDEIPGGYRLSDGRTVADLADLHRQYGVIIIDDVPHDTQ